MNVTFAYQLPVEAWIALGCGLAALAVMWLGGPWRWRRVRRAARVTAPAGDAGEDPLTGLDEPVSVIVYARNQASGLARLLPRLLSQKTRAPFEVIVVNEGDASATTRVVEQLRMSHPNLYLTFTPDGAHSLSRKKLAIMVGLKATRNRVAVLTTATACIDSDDWLAMMTAPFADPAVQVVLGNAIPDPEGDKALFARNRAFVRATDNLTWLAAALGGHPYRGDGLNLAYTRQAFFDNRGFSRSLNIKAGDDDIFVNEISHGGNTRVVLGPGARVTERPYDPRLTARLERRSRRFTGRHLPRLPRRLTALSAWSLWAVLGCCAAAALLSWPNATGACVAVLLAVAALVTATVSWRRAIMAIGGRRLGLTLPVLILWYPMGNMFNTVTSRATRSTNYTWK